MVYDVTEKDIPISSTVYCEYTENTNLIRTANMDVSNHTLTPFSAKHLLVVIFTNVKKGIWNQRKFTFQAVLASDGNETFAILNYFKLEGDATYIGHFEDFCQDSIFYESLGSTELVHTSNVGIPGRHVFKLTSEIGCIRASECVILRYLACLHVVIFLHFYNYQFNIVSKAAFYKSTLV